MSTDSNLKTTTTMRKSKILRKSYEMLRNQAIDAVTEILNGREDDTMDLFDTELYFDIEGERAEVLGVQNNDDCIPELHYKFTDGDYSRYDSMEITYLPLTDIFELLSTMEDNEEVEYQTN